MPISHFLGALVVQSPEQDDEAQREEVIDGQQRLTTLSCLISVLWEYANQVEDQRLKADLTGTLASMLATGAVDREPNLILNRDNGFFAGSIVERLTQNDRIAYWNSQNISRQPVAKRLRKAIEFFDEKLNSFCDNAGAHRDDTLKELIQTLTECVIVLKITVKEHRMAYRLFETLNFRGLRLSQADLLKNELLRIASEQGQQQHDQVVDHWSELLNELSVQERLDLPEYIQHQFISASKPVKASALFETIPGYLDERGISPDKYVAKISSEAQLLAQIVSGDQQWDQSTNDLLLELVSPLNIKYSIPLLLAAGTRFRNEPDSFGKMAKVVRDFCFRFFTVGNASVGSLEKVIGEASRTLRERDRNPRDTVKFLREYSSDSIFIENFSEVTFKTSKLGFYVIEKIENALSKNAGVNLYRQSPAQHLEHIMPKRPGQYWEYVKGDERYEDYLNRLGNFLVLEADINKKIKNKEFDFKQKYYKGSRMKLPHQVEEFCQGDRWTFESIVNRQKELAENYACQIWPLKWE